MIDQHADLARVYALDSLQDRVLQLFAIVRAADLVAGFDWGTSVSESYHFQRIAAMGTLRRELERLNR